MSRCGLRLGMRCNLQSIIVCTKSGIRSSNLLEASGFISILSQFSYLRHLFQGNLERILPTRALGMGAKCSLLGHQHLLLHRWHRVSVQCPESDFQAEDPEEFVEIHPRAMILPVVVQDPAEVACLES